MAAPPIPLTFPVSVRQKALRAIKRVYEEANPGLLALYGWNFSGIELGGLDDFDFTKRAMLGIVPGTERKDPLFPLVNSIVPVSIEFHYTRNQKEAEPQIIAEGVLAIVQNILYKNRRLTFPPDGPLVIDIFETGNELDLATYGDKSIAGVVQFDVKYRHGINDVTSDNPEF